jgi:integrase
LTEEGVRTLRPTPGKQVSYFDKIVPGLLLRVSWGGAKQWRVLQYVKVPHPANPEKHRTIARSHPLGRYPVLKLDEARQRAREFLQNPDGFKKKARALPFAAMADKFMAIYVRKEDERDESRRRERALRSEREIRRCLDRYVMPQWRTRDFEGISRGDVTTLLDHTARHNGPRQADVVLAIVSKMMRWHQSRTDGYVCPIVPGMKRADGRSRDRVLSPQEVQHLWQICEGEGAYGAALQLCLLTGQRYGAVAAMRWEHIVDGCWHVPAESRAKGVGGTLELPPIAMAILARQPRFDGNPYVFAVSHGRKRCHLTYSSKRKTAIDRRLGQIASGMKPWRVHDLRRTARTLMTQAGVSTEIAERVLGHKQADVEEIYNRYRYVREKGIALAKLASLIEATVHPRENVVSMARKTGST